MKRLRSQAMSAQRGITLIELVVSILIVSLGVAGILVVITQATRSSADPMVTDQAVAIAEAYLEEILLKDFSDPDQPESGGPEGGESRPTYDDVNDYNGLSDAGARDQNNNPIAGLGQYNVSVSVASAADLGPAGGQTPAADTLRVIVQVGAPNGVNISLSGYRSNYGP